jgi:hypothetical protein
MLSLGEDTGGDSLLLFRDIDSLVPAGKTMRNPFYIMLALFFFFI